MFDVGKISAYCKIIMSLAINYNSINGRSFQVLFEPARIISSGTDSYEVNVYFFIGRAMKQPF